MTRNRYEDRDPFLGFSVDTFPDKKIWGKRKPPGFGPQVLVVSIFQPLNPLNTFKTKKLAGNHQVNASDNPCWGYPISGNHTQIWPEPPHGSHAAASPRRSRAAPRPIGARWPGTCPSPRADSGQVPEWSPGKTCKPRLVIHRWDRSFPLHSNMLKVQNYKKYTKKNSSSRLQTSTSPKTSKKSLQVQGHWRQEATKPTSWSALVMDQVQSLLLKRCSKGT